MADAKAKEKPIASLIAGATAGGVEAFITYPLENLKTQLQFGGPNGQVSAESCELYRRSLSLLRTQC